MSAALRESMRLSQGGVDDIERLSQFLKAAEVNTMSLERLQPENSQLKSKLETVQGDLSKKNLWASELESKSLAYKARFEETHTELETARGRLADLEESLRDVGSRKEDSEVALDKIQAERGELLVMIEDLKSENIAILDKIQSLRSAEQDLSRRNTELEKQAETLTAQISDERRKKEASSQDLKTLRLDFSELKADHIESLSKLDKACYEVDSSQQALADHRQRSDDKIFALNSAIDGLKAQAKISDDMSRYDDIEKEKLKSDADREHLRADELSTRLDKKSKEMADSRAALSRAKNNYEALNNKFLALLSEMERLSGDHKKQSKKLEQYSSISGVAVGQSFYEGRDRSSKRTAAKTSDAAAPKLKLVGDKAK